MSTELTQDDGAAVIKQTSLLDVCAKREAELLNEHGLLAQRLAAVEGRLQEVQKFRAIILGARPEAAGEPAQPASE